MLQKARSQILQKRNTLQNKLHDVIHKYYKNRLHEMLNIHFENP